MDWLVIILVIFMIYAGLASASPSESDIKICTDHGQSRETCLNAVMP